MQRGDLKDMLASHEARSARQDWLDGEIASWTRTKSAREVLRLLREHDVPVGPINSARELATDAHIAARDMIVRLAGVPMPGVVPKLSRTPGVISHAGPALGAHTDEVLRDLAQCRDAEIDVLRNDGVVA
jgi:crotonobetainyl-CoA:carnitine CoA-transferase CaiB-like acyl-CoA transferase